MPSSYLFTNNSLTLEMQIVGERLFLSRLSSTGHSWIHPDKPASLFAVWIDCEGYDATNLAVCDILVENSSEGIQHCITTFPALGFTVQFHILFYDKAALLETWVEVENTGATEITIDRIDSFSINIPKDEYELEYFLSDWGQEFEQRRGPLSERTILETRAGRSSKGMHPWFTLFRKDGVGISGSVAWSGNWILRFEPNQDGYTISGGLHDWEFSKKLIPGEKMSSPACILAFGKDNNAIAQQYHKAGRLYWYPRIPLATQIPVEWNPWWCYEDKDINQAVFLENIKAATALGVNVCTLDAGWFGPSQAEADWFEYRGDWDQVNRKRFPDGIKAVSDATHQHQMYFGLWCEIEGLGKKALLASQHAEFAAMRDGRWLGYVCFGNFEAREWAYETLRRLITENSCDWLKLDFNVDPGAGCNRQDHGHQSGDGLYEHYLGYYQILDRLRVEFPNVVLENCSSGGLRIDLGMMRHTHLTYLSDPDWPVHSLQVFWGASLMLAPEVCLHWSFSEWQEGNGPPQQTFNPHNPNLTIEKLDYYTRISMLGVFGVSQKLPELPAWIEQRLEYHIRIYKEEIRRFIHSAILFRLTKQPQRNGSGDRWCAFEYLLPESGECLLFVFRLPGAEKERRLVLRNLVSDRMYTIRSFGDDQQQQFRGDELMSRGLLFDGLPEEGSALLLIT